MALTKQKKHLKVATLAADIQNSTSAIVGTFTGLNATKDIALRKAVRDAGGSYHVVKNKLAPKAAVGTQIEGALLGLKGVSAVAYTSGDPVALAKALATWVKDNSEFTFKLGIVEGKIIDISEINALATMPSKDELFSKLLYLMNAPAQRLVTVINATGRDLAVVINQGVEKGKFAGAAGPEAVAAEPEAVAAEPEAAEPEAVAVAAEPAKPAAEAAAPAADTEGASEQAVQAATEAPAEG